MDYWIVRGNLLSYGLINLDPSKGLQIPPFLPPPDQYHFQSRGPAIIGACSIIVVIMLSVIVARLLVRKFRKDLTFGKDDYLIIPAVVRSQPGFQLNP